MSEKKTTLPSPLGELDRLIDWARAKGLELHEADIGGARIIFTDHQRTAGAGDEEPTDPDDRGADEGWEPEDSPPDLYGQMAQKFGVERADQRSTRRSRGKK